LNFIGGFSKNTEILNFMKIRLVGAELFHAYGQKDGRTDRTDMTRITAAFCNFTNAPKNQSVNVV